METTRRLVSYEDLEVPSSSSLPAPASTSIPPPTVQIYKQRVDSTPAKADTHTAQTSSISSDPGSSPATNSTHDVSLSYAKKKRIRRQKALEAKLSRQQLASRPVNGTQQANGAPKASGGGEDEEAEEGIESYQDIKKGKKRRRNEDNKVQKDSLRQHMEGQWQANGAALGGLDYDGLAEDQQQNGTHQQGAYLSSSSKQRKVGDHNVQLRSAPLPSSAAWQEHQGENGWADGPTQDQNDEYEEGEEYTYEEDYDESIQAEWDAMARLDTFIAIPDIPAAFLGEEDTELAEQSTADDTAPALDGSRVLTEEELWQETALVDAWKAATEGYVSFQTKGQGSSHQSPTNESSALWYHAPAPGSKAASKARQNSENNKVRRALRLFTEGQARKAKEIENLRLEVEKEQLQVQVQGEGAEERQNKTSAATVPTNPPNISTAAVPAAGSSLPTTYLPKANPVGLRSLTGRAIPPSIGLAGNAAWQSACATVASTRNRIGAEKIVVPKSNDSKTTACTSAIGNESTESRVETTSMLEQQGSAVGLDVSTPMRVDDRPSFQAPIPAIAFESSRRHADSTHAGEHQSHHQHRHQPQPPLCIWETLSSGVQPQGESGSTGGGELLQRICSSWYYAGYWTAQWEEEDRRRGREREREQQEREDGESFGKEGR